MTRSREFAFAGRDDRTCIARRDALQTVQISGLGRSDTLLTTRDGNGAFSDSGRHHKHISAGQHQITKANCELFRMRGEKSLCIVSIQVYSQLIPSLHNALE